MKKIRVLKLLENLRADSQNDTHFESMLRLQQVKYNNKKREKFMPLIKVLIDMDKYGTADMSVWIEDEE